MEIRDPIHGHIEIASQELGIIAHPLFQRLRGVKQLGLSDVAFPGATHTRYLHSLAVGHLSKVIFQQLFPDILQRKDLDLQRLQWTLSTSALLHDVGHAPLSHASEVAMPALSTLGLKGPLFKGTPDRQANHEDYSFKIITDSGLTEGFKPLRLQFGVQEEEVAALLVGQTSNPEYFTYRGVNYFPLLHQLISSELDVDRMDYLRRDSYFCGVPYGQFDWQWLTRHLTVATLDGKAYLGIKARAISTFEDYLLSRFHMFMMVYFHYRAVCLEQMLLHYFTSAENQYHFPKKIDDYASHDDHYLIQQLKGSNNRWAKRLIHNDIPAKIFESYGEEVLKEQDRFEEIKQLLQEAQVEYILCESRNRLSKYSQSQSGATNEPYYPIYIERQPGHQLTYAYVPSNKDIPYIPLTEVTSLFDKYQHQHSLKRIHCDLDAHPSLKIKIHQILER